MIQYPPSLLQIGGAHTGIAPANLLDIQTVEGSVYYWCDRGSDPRPFLAPCVIPPVGGNAGDVVSYKPWILSVGAWKFFRSLQSTTGSFIVQNVSGDSMKRDVEVILRASAMEGALAVYRMWESAEQAARLEVHCTITADEITETELSLKATDLLNASQGDTPAETYSETCQLVWASNRCGATGSVECQYSFQSCQVVERFMGIMNSYEKNYGEAITSMPPTLINRRRKI
jgi:hypothetical protein